ncbi:MAG: transglycosylase SLT domain-containing protein [Deltaproteobacteria bacterium]|nr:transglycosylase SLT domain-containing protein [Deltaproteobacteria bacterium]
MSVLKFKGIPLAEPNVNLLPIGTNETEQEQGAAQFTAEKHLSSPSSGILQAIGKALFLTLRFSAQAVYVTLRTIWTYLYRHPIHAVLNLGFITVLALLVLTGSEFHKQTILAKISDQTVEEIIRGSRFTRTYDSEEVSKNGIREFLSVGAPEWAQRESVRAVLFHARKAGLPLEDQAVLLAIADIESGFNPMARAPTTSACGLFQFVKRTGESFSLSASDCMNPWLNAKSAVEHYSYNYERRVRRQVEDLSGAERVFRTFELSYYLHHDGPESSNPSNDVKATVVSGTQFLFKAYHALLQEAELEQHAPSFATTFSANFLHSLDRITSYFADSDLPIIGKMGALQASELKSPKA